MEYNILTKVLSDHWLLIKSFDTKTLFKNKKHEQNRSIEGICATLSLKLFNRLDLDNQLLLHD